MKKFIPMLYSTPMVNAIQQDRKTKTRRQLKKQPVLDPQTGDVLNSFYGGREEVQPIEEWCVSHVKYASPYNVGDVIWIRETHFSGFLLDENDHVSDEPVLLYKSDTPSDRRPFDMSDERCMHLFGQDKSDWPKWKPGIHMPMTAARLFLEVVSVKVERLHSISQEDIISEGVCYGEEFNKELCIWRDSVSGIHATRIKFFKNIWETINGNWDANAFVWVIEFKKIDQPAEWTDYVRANSLKKLVKAVEKKTGEKIVGVTGHFNSLEDRLNI